MLGVTFLYAALLLLALLITPLLVPAHLLEENLGVLQSQRYTSEYYEPEEKAVDLNLRQRR